MIITINLSARNPDETSDYVRHVADRIGKGFTSGMDNDDEGYWDSEGLSE